MRSDARRALFQYRRFGCSDAFPAVSREMESGDEGVVEIGVCGGCGLAIGGKMGGCGLAIGFLLPGVILLLRDFARNKTVAFHTPCPNRPFEFL